MDRRGRRPFRCIDVCAGAGGLSLGLERAGFSTHGVELDDLAAGVHRLYVGPCDTADISTWSPSGPADVVAGGVPCQPFSSAGMRKGFDDVRGSLFIHLVRIAKEANARAVVLENVVGLTNWQGGRAMREIQACYREAGFEHVYSCVLNAADYGVPQHRRRVFIVGFREAVRFEWPTPTHGPSLWASRPWVSVREALDLDGQFAVGKVPWSTSIHLAGMRMLNVDKPAVTVRCGDNQEYLSRLDRPAPTITTRAYDEGRDQTRPSRRPVAELRAALDATGLTDRPATVIACRSSVAKAGHHVQHQRGAVRLDPEQCALLQSFPPGWKWPDPKRAAHRLIGNAVPPLLGEAVGRSVRHALESAVAADRRVA